MRQFLTAAVDSFDPVAAVRTGHAACHAERRDRAVVREYRRGHLLEKAHAARAAVAAMPAAGAARSGTDRVALEQDRVTELKHFGIRESRIGHVRLHDVGPSKPSSADVRSRIPAPDPPEMVS